MTFTGNLVYDILAAVLLIVLSFVGAKLGKYFGSKVDTQQRTLIETIAMQVVVYVQQKYGELNGEAKFDKAYLRVSEELAKLGISLTPDQIEVLIESSLKKAKNDFVDNWSNKESNKEVK